MDRKEDFIGFFPKIFTNGHINHMLAGQGRKFCHLEQCPFEHERTGGMVEAHDGFFLY